MDTSDNNGGINDPSTEEFSSNSLEQLVLAFSSSFFFFFEFNIFFNRRKFCSHIFAHIFVQFQLTIHDLTGNFVSNVAYWQYAYIVCYVAYRVVTSCIRIL